MISPRSPRDLPVIAQVTREALPSPIVDVYFIVLVFVSNYTLLNLVIALLLTSFDVTYRHLPSPTVTYRYIPLHTVKGDRPPAHLLRRHLPLPTVTYRYLPLQVIALLLTSFDGSGDEKLKELAGKDLSAEDLSDYGV